MSYYQDGVCYEENDDDDSEDDYDGTDDNMSEDDDYFVDCDYCSSEVRRSNYEKHLENVHKCRYCTNYMPKPSIKKHIQDKHIKKCPHCHVEMLETELNQHIATHNNRNNRSHEGPVGMIQLGKLSDERFNSLVSANCVYAKDGQLYIK